MRPSREQTADNMEENMHEAKTLTIVSMNQSQTRGLMTDMNYEMPDAEATGSESRGSWSGADCVR